MCRPSIQRRDGPHVAERLSKRLHRQLHLLVAAGLVSTAHLASSMPANDLAAPSKVREVGAAVSAGLDPRRAFAADGWTWGLECLGKATHAADITERGLHANSDGKLEPGLRFGKVPDPLDPSSTVFSFTAHRDDPRMWGAPRCEVIFSPTKKGRLPIGTEFWFGFGLLLPGWAASPDEQIVSQWHMGDGSIAFNPLFAISVQGAGLRFQARFNASREMSKAGTSKPIDLVSEGLPVSAWTYIVARARISTDPADAPFLQVWRDGVELISYAGQLGYAIPGGVPYAKFGHYHWIDTSNPWPAQIASRTVLIRSPMFIFNNASKFQPADLLEFLRRQ